MTKKDLKNGMIVECRNGNRYVLLNDNLVREHGYFGFYTVTNDLGDIHGNKEFEIVKVYEPHKVTGFDDIFENSRLKLIWERKEILDDVEKKYLSGVIAPFRDRVVYIEKLHWSEEYDIISIRVKHLDGIHLESIYLPTFESDKMYKGMKPRVEYTLEELGL